jgi:tetratricopeptide (TPR) repeat protein
MPQTQKDMMGQMFMAEIGAASEVEKSDKLIDPEKQSLSTSNQYIQDLYRFFRVHPQKADFDDPFNWKLDFHNKKFVNYIFPNQELLPALGDYLFKKDRYAESLEVFNLLGQQQQPDIQIIQKQAFCYQQEDNYKQALKYYLEADLFDHQQVWNLKKIALCYRHLNNPEKALEFYKKAEKINPDNLHTQVSIGHCLFELKQFEEALKYYFKVEYLDPKNSKIWRPIVWCALALGKFEQAEKYSRKLLNDHPSQHDYLNMGHIKWCNGHRQEAIEWYQKCVTFPGYSLDEFLETFENDRQLLISHHVDENDIPIMLDQLRYYLQNQ